MKNYSLDKHKTIALVSCVKEKRNVKSLAKKLYISPLFNGIMNLAKQSNPDYIYILSGKHHLIELEKEIAPYDLNLDLCSENEKIEWANTVIKSLKKVADLENDMFLFYTNYQYRKNLIPFMKNFRIEFDIK